VSKSWTNESSFQVQNTGRFEVEDLAKHLFETIQWAQSVETLFSKTAVEFSGLSRRILLLQPASLANL
jgi:hypothetical protein